MPNPLSPEEIRRVDAHWRAANYLSVGQIYLYANPLLTEPLQAELLSFLEAVRDKRPSPVSPPASRGSLAIASSTTSVAARSAPPISPMERPARRKYHAPISVIDTNDSRWKPIAHATALVSSSCANVFAA